MSAVRNKKPAFLKAGQHLTQRRHVLGVEALSSPKLANVCILEALEWECLYFLGLALSVGSGSCQNFISLPCLI